MTEVKLRLGVTTPPSFTGTTKKSAKSTIPVIEFGIQIGGKTVTRPQSFLNEAKLTQLALSVRFAASLVNLHESDLKLLVLDDLLVSLDMSNRMKVVQILLSDTFDSYQKIILTHDLGLFQEFRRKVGTRHTEWCFLRLEGNAAKSIVCRPQKSEIQRAEEYLHGHALDEAAFCLRKAVEDMAMRWREWIEGRSLPPGKFFSLTENLRAAKRRLVAELPLDIFERIVEPTPKAHRTLLVATDDTDIDSNAALDAGTKGILKSKRTRLRQAFTADHEERVRRIKLIDELLACTERVLNPAAHSGTTPLYEKEVQDALQLIKNLENSLHP